jgi:hypothetical protein
MAQPHETPSTESAYSAPSAAAAHSHAAVIALNFSDSAYADRANRSWITRPYRRLRRHVRHTPTSSVVLSGIAIAIAVIVLVGAVSSGVI